MRFLLALSLLMLPLAAAGPAPAIHFLADDGLPLQDGALSTATPSKNESSQRLVTIGLQGPSTTFSAPVEQGRIFGPVFLGLWTTANPVVQGELNATLWIESEGEQTLLASKAINVAVDPANLPDPMNLIPPDPTNPEAAVFHVASQALPLIVKPPMVFDLGRIDAVAPENASLVLGLSLDGDPIALGASVIQYDGILSPSFLYVPWYAPDQPVPTPTPTPSPTQSPSPTSSASSSSTSTSTSASSSSSATSQAPQEDSPGAGLIATLAVLGAAAYVMRRK